MRGLYLLEPGKLQLRSDHDTSGPLPDDFVRIRTHYAGVCSTDVGYYTHGSSKLRLPVILGHEVSGIIEAVGSSVTGLQPGDAVTVMNDYHLCGKCRQVAICIVLFSRFHKNLASFVIVKILYHIHNFFAIR